MTPEELQKPPTEIEVAELLNAANKTDYHLSNEGIKILRRLAFDWNRLKYRLNHQTEDDIESCKRGLHKDCGK